MKTKIRTFLKLPVGMGAACALFAGCMTANDDRLHKKVSAWVPVGTSAPEAARVMGSRGFHCLRGYMAAGTLSGANLECRRTNHVINRVWVVRLYLKDDRVTASEEQIFNDPFRLFEDMH